MKYLVLFLVPLNLWETVVTGGIKEEQMHWRIVGNSMHIYVVSDNYPYHIIKVPKEIDLSIANKKQLVGTYQKKFGVLRKKVNWAYSYDVEDIGEVLAYVHDKNNVAIVWHDTRIKEATVSIIVPIKNPE